MSASEASTQTLNPSIPTVQEAAESSPKGAQDSGLRLTALTLTIHLNRPKAAEAPPEAALPHVESPEALGSDFANRGSCPPRPQVSRCQAVVDLGFRVRGLASIERGVKGFRVLGCSVLSHGA